MHEVEVRCCLNSESQSSIYTHHILDRTGVRKWPECRLLFSLCSKWKVRRMLLWRDSCWKMWVYYNCSITIQVTIATSRKTYFIGCRSYAVLPSDIFISFSSCFPVSTFEWKNNAIDGKPPNSWECCQIQACILQVVSMAHHSHLFQHPNMLHLSSRNLWTLSLM